MTTQPILCGTDFSAPARAAADVAAALAKRLRVPLWLVHASEIPDSPLTKEHFTAELQRLRAAGTEADGEIMEGAADEALFEAAGDHSAQLLVVASLGRRAPVRWLLGSVAERAAESSPVPTLVVRDSAPLEAWARGERPLQVFVGVDFTVTSDSALRWVGCLRKLGPCEVTVAYADWPEEEAARLGTRGPRHFPENPIFIQHILERDLKTKANAILGEENVHVMVEGGWVRRNAQLVTMARDTMADLIVVGTHQRHGLSRLGEMSVSSGILHHAPMNVACVPTPTAGRLAVPRIHECERVLVAVDLQEPHGFAAAYGYGICRPGGAVRLVHVRQNCEDRTEEKGGECVAELEEQLRALALEEPAARRIRTEVEVIDNPNPARGIDVAAERFNADVVCVGGHTRPGFVAKALGSVTLGVLQRSRRPVLVVWPPAE